MADAVVIPGGRFGPGAGLLMYVGLAAQRRGASVHWHWWSRQPPAGLGEQTAAAVRDEITGVVKEIAGNPLLIGKSLGTLAASVAAERSLHAVWLTPLLTVPHGVAALGRATAPFMLAGGTADRHWDGELARRLTPHVLEVEDADHGMCVPGPLTESTAALGRLIDSVEKFLDAISWPHQPNDVPRLLSVASQFCGRTPCPLSALVLDPAQNAGRALTPMSLSHNSLSGLAKRLRGVGGCGRPASAPSTVPGMRNLQDEDLSTT